VEKFEQKLQPAEDLIAGKLRNLINSKKSNTVEVITIHSIITYFLWYILTIKTLLLILK